MITIAVGLSLGWIVAKDQVPFIRVVEFNGGNLQKLDADLKPVDITDGGWGKAKYYLGKAPPPFTGDLIIAGPLKTNSVVIAVIGLLKGRQHGQSAILYRNGTTKSEGSYKHGVPVGNFHGWHENGKKRFDAVLNEGKLKSLKEWSPAGVPKSFGRLPKRLPSYIRESKIDTILAKQGETRSVFGQLDFDNMRLDSWLRTRASSEQKARYAYILNNLRASQRNLSRGEALASAHKQIRSPDYLHRYLLFIYYGEESLGGSSITGGTVRDLSAQQLEKAQELSSQLLKPQ